MGVGGLTRSGGATGLPLAWLFYPSALGFVPLSVSKGSHRGSGSPSSLPDSCRTPRCRPSLPSESLEAAQELESQIKERQGLFFDMEAYLPKKNG